MKLCKMVCIAVLVTVHMAWPLPVSAETTLDDMNGPSNEVSLPTEAAEASEEVAQQPPGAPAGEKPLRVDIDGTFVAFTAETGYPYVDVHRRTLVPLRAAMEALGCQVTWQGERLTAVLEKDGIEVEVPVGESYVRKDGLEVFMDTRSVLEKGRIYLPIRAVAEAFGADVQWNQVTKTVVITSDEGKERVLSVHFIDVGHGDAIFIDDGAYEVLIDAGTTSSGILVSETIRPYVDGNLDLLIATHGHQDHIGGVPKILEDYQVDRIIESGTSVNTPEWRDYKAALDREPDCLVGTAEDEVIQLSEGVNLRIIKPPLGQELENNNSVGALLTYGQVSFLFTGDSQAEEEAVLAQQMGKVDVFKASHHGSYNANSTLLLNKIHPEYVVISAGRGVGYTHPHASALKRMFSAGATVYGTFKSGTILLKTDGQAYSFQTAAKPLIPLVVKDAGTYQQNIL